MRTKSSMSSGSWKGNVMASGKPILVGIISLVIRLERFLQRQVGLVLVGVNLQSQQLRLVLVNDLVVRISASEGVVSLWKMLKEFDCLAAIELNRFAQHVVVEKEPSVGYNLGHLFLPV